MNKNNFRRLARILLPALAVTVLLGLAAKYQTSTSPFAALAVPAPSASAAPAPVCVPILLYHSVLSDSARAGDYVVSPAVFRADMDYLRSHGYTAVFLSQLYAYETAGTPLPEKPVVITLDDGYLNNLTNVLPILRETDMRAVSEDKQAATLMGINVNSTILITFAIGAGLAGVAALMYVAQYPAATNVMTVPPYK